MARLLKIIIATLAVCTCLISAQHCHRDEDCNAGYRCRSSECEWRLDCPMPAPPVGGLQPGCSYVNRISADGCPAPEVVCNNGTKQCHRDEDCDAGNRCRAGQCEWRMDCPVPGLVAPRPGCTYVDKILENGCPKPELVCNNDGTWHCGQNEEWKTCGACDGTCTNMHRACGFACRPAECGCMPGYFRNNQQRCVSETECLKNNNNNNQRCGKNEEFLVCGSPCEPSCKRPHPRICTKNCIPDQCQCLKGYYRHDSGACVPQHECSKYTQ